ncbi:MAG: ROK family protein, partial [Planctomycetes bacterium]|nr:ROK family protein [Planctomycetota bacterium]
IAAAVDFVPSDNGRAVWVGIGLPGIIRDNAIRLAPHFSDFPLDALRTAVRRRHGASVLYENGVNLGAMGEVWKGAGREYNNILYVSYGVGIGAALIIGGRLYQGADGAAGEIGFALVPPAPADRRSGTSTGTGESGELEKALSPERFGLAPVAGRRRRTDPSNSLDDAAMETLSDLFSIALTNAAALLNPNAVIVSGGWGKALGGRYLTAWKERMASALPFPPALFLSDLDNRETMFGAVHTALEYAEALPFISNRDL